MKIRHIYFGKDLLPNYHPPPLPPLLKKNPRAPKTKAITA